MDKTKMAVDLFNKCAVAYQDKYMDTYLYHHTFDVFCKNIIKTNATILELACGPGNITQYLLKQRPDLKISGTDLSPNMIELAAINNPEADFQLMDCRDIGRLGKKYDGIMCGFCLPYLTKDEAIQLIADAAALLNPDGVLYISTMEDDDSRSGLHSSSSGEQMYIQYHQADYLEQALKENNFRVIYLQRQDFPTTDDTKTTDLIIIAVR